jgi:hypothetical protein
MMSAMDWIVASCRQQLLGESGLVPIADFDGAEILPLAQAQGVLPLVYHALQAQGWSNIAPALQIQFEQAFHAQVRQNFRLVARLRSVLQWFNAAPIPVLPFKGPLLTMQLYSNLTQRRMRDLDLLLLPQDVYRAHELLFAHGYECCDPLSPRQLRQRLRVNYENALFHPETGQQLDLHWGLVPYYYPGQPSPRELFARAQPTDWQGEPCLTLSLADCGLMLCLNGLKEGWLDLQRLCDVAILLHQAESLDWQSLLWYARGQDSDRALLLGLSLTAKLFQLPLPWSVKNALERDPIVQKVRDRLHFQLLHPEAQEWNLIAQTVLPLTLQRRWSSKLFALGQLILPINERDLAYFSLPRWLFWLYYPLRLWRLIVKYSRLWVYLRRHQ